MANKSNKIVDDPNDPNGSSQSYEKKLDEIINKFMAVIPLIAYASDLSSQKLFIIILPIVTMLLKPLLIKYLFQKKKTVQSVDNVRYIYRFSKISGYGHNTAYDHIEKYLDRKLRSMNINNCYSDESEYNSYRAKFLLPYDQPMELKWRDYTLNISKYLSDALSGSSDSSRSKVPLIQISTKSDLSVIDDFIAEVQEIERKREQESRLVKDQIMTYDTSNKTWKKKPIKIKKNFENTFIKEKDLKMIRKSLKYFKEKESIYDMRGTPYKKSFLLYGEPGCGKTSFIYAVARETQRNIYLIPRISDEDKMKEAIGLIPDGSLVIAEEIDTIDALRPRNANSDLMSIMGSSLCAYGPLNKTESSSSDDDSSDEGFSLFSDNDEDEGKDENKKETKTATVKGKRKRKPSMTNYYREKLKIYLELLDGYDTFRDCIIIMTTNHLEDIDKAVYRPGRVDHMIEFTFADQYQIKNIFKVFYDIDLEDDLLDKLAKRKQTTSYIINTAINPNLDEPDKALNILLGLEDN